MAEGLHTRRCAFFGLRMEAEVTDLLFDNERIVGVRAIAPQGELDCERIWSWSSRS
jgi:hypothetical protein